MNLDGIVQIDYYDVVTPNSFDVTGTFVDVIDIVDSQNPCIYGSKFYYTAFLTSQCHKISNTLGMLYSFPKTKSFEYKFKAKLRLENFLHGCVPYTRIWVFFVIFQNIESLLPLYLSL